MSVPVKGKYDFLDLGNWNAMCAECGRKGKALQMVQLPDGIPGARLRVHPECYTARNPQDFVRGIPDNQTPPWTQPEPAPTYIAFCSTTSGIAGYAVAGCAIAGRNLIPYGVA